MRHIYYMKTRTPDADIRQAFTTLTGALRTFKVPPAYQVAYRQIQETGCYVYKNSVIHKVPLNENKR